MANRHQEALAAAREHPEVKSPVQVHKEHLSFNDKLGLKITSIVGTMGAAYAFVALALISLPAAIHSHDPIVIVAWIAQTFLQLVLLPVIIVGQNLQSRQAEIKAETDHLLLTSLHTMQKEQMTSHAFENDALKKLLARDETGEQ